MKCALKRENIRCYVCDKTFKKREYLQKHLKVQHSFDGLTTTKDTVDPCVEGNADTDSIGEDPDIDLGCGNEDEAVEIHKKVPSDIESAPTKRKATSPLLPGVRKVIATATGPSLKQGEICLKREVKGATKEQYVKLSEGGTTVYENSVKVRVDVSTGTTKVNLGQYLKAKCIQPESLSLEFRDDGEIKIGFTMEK